LNTLHIQLSALAAGASIGSYPPKLTLLAAMAVILRGMVGFLTGITRTPFTSAILIAIV
jgi:hypothetical protein